MPEIYKEINVRATLEDTWALVSDMERFSLCIPGCKKVTKISETEFDWDLETKVLHTTRKAKARTKAIVMQAPTHSEFVGEGRLFERSNHYKLTIKGTSDLEVISDTQTRIKYAGVINASGLGGAIVEKVVAGQMDSLFQEFEANIKQTLGDTGEDVPEVETTSENATESASDTDKKINFPIWGAVAVIAIVAAYFLFI